MQVDPWLASLKDEDRVLADGYRRLTRGTGVTNKQDPSRGPAATLGDRFTHGKIETRGVVPGGVARTGNLPATWQLEPPHG
jgi:hypothetical protein